MNRSEGDWTLPAALALLAILFAVQVRQTAPPAPLGVDADRGVFSAGRARDELSNLLGDEAPHPVGSAANRAVKERLIARLTELGLKPEEQRTIGCAAESATCAQVENVLAAIPGRDCRHDRVDGALRFSAERARRGRRRRCRCGAARDDAHRQAGRALSKHDPDGVHRRRGNGPARCGGFLRGEPGRETCQGRDQPRGIRIRGAGVPAAYRAGERRTDGRVPRRRAASLCAIVHRGDLQAHAERHRLLGVAACGAARHRFRLRRRTQSLSHAARLDRQSRPRHAATPRRKHAAAAADTRRCRPFGDRTERGLCQPRQAALAALVARNGHRAGCDRRGAASLRNLARSRAAATAARCASPLASPRCSSPQA